jgi:hypothetical protein
MLADEIIQVPNAKIHVTPDERIHVTKCVYSCHLLQKQLIGAFMLPDNVFNQLSLEA